MGPFDRILVPVGPAASVERALVIALDLVRRTGVPLRLLSVGRPIHEHELAARVAVLTRAGAPAPHVETRVVAYDERGGIYATRLWWILNHYGHSSVAVLDGGWVKWTADGRPTNATAPTVTPARFKVHPGTVKVASLDDVKHAINRTGTKLIDARTQAEIDGKDLRNIKRGGYIESSVPVYWEDTLNSDSKTFKSAAEIERLFRAKGIQPGDNVVAYCQVGMRASHDLFTLALIGHDLAKLTNYYGSWEEWGNREDTPIKTGPH